MTSRSSRCRYTSQVWRKCTVTLLGAVGTTIALHPHRKSEYIRTTSGRRGEADGAYALIDFAEWYWAAPGG